MTYDEAVKRLDELSSSCVREALEQNVTCEDVVKSIGASLIAVVMMHFSECEGVTPTREHVRAVFEDLLNHIEFDDEPKAAPDPAEKAETKEPDTSLN